MSKFRFGISNIKTHYFRFRSCVSNDLLCPMCKMCTEDELHFVLCCPFLNSLRKEYIAEKYYRYPSRFRLSILFTSKNEIVIRKLCIFLYKGFKLRESFML